MSVRDLLLRLSEGAYRLLLLTFPAGFRREQGQETVRFFRDRMRRVVDERGLRALPGLWLRSYPDAVMQGLAERFGRPRSRWRPDILLTELGQTVRGLARAPSFSLTVVSTFGLALGATAVVVALARGIFFHPFPFPADDLYVVRQQFGGGASVMTSTLALERLEEEDVVEAVGSYRPWVTTMTGAGDPVRYPQAIVSHDYFDVTGVAPALGREFTSGEEGPDSPRTMVVSHAVWTTRFGADPSALGRVVELDGEPHRLIGVMPKDFRDPAEYLRFEEEPHQIWVTPDDDLARRGLRYIGVRGFVRLTPGTTLDRAQAAVRTLGPRLTEEMEEDRELRLELVPLRDHVVEGGEPAILILLVAAGLVLLVGCANVTNLVLARGLARSDDLAVRTALGAGRSDLIRHTVLESVVLGGLGGVLGLVLGQVGIRGILAVAPPFPFREAIEVEPVTATVSMGLALAAAVLAGLVPAFRLLRTRSPLLPTSTRSMSASPGGRRLQRAFAVSQVTLAVALLVGALLLARSFQSLLEVPRGYDAEGVRVAHLDLPASRYDSSAQRRTTLEAIAERLSRHPEVEAVGYASAVPHMGINNRSLAVIVEGRDTAYGFFRAVTPGYADAIGLRVLQGRSLSADDIAGGRPVSVVVNEVFAERFLQDGEVLGRHLSLEGHEGLSVVGVVQEMKHISLAQVRMPEVYVPLVGSYATVFLTARTADRSTDELAALIRREVRAVDPLIPTDRVPSLRELEAEAVAAERAMMFIMLTLAVVAVAMASLGTYGVLAQTVSRRRREVGIRVALGATPRKVVRMVVIQGLGMVMTGLAAGLLLAFWGGRILERVLFGVSARDPLTYAAVALLLGGLSVAASWLPARRAVNVDPSEALRTE